MVEILTMISKTAFMLFVVCTAFTVYYWFHYQIPNVYRDIKGKANKEFISAFSDSKNLNKKQAVFKNLTMRTETSPSAVGIENNETEIGITDDYDATVIMGDDGITQISYEENQTVLLSSLNKNVTVQDTTLKEAETEIINDDETVCLNEAENDAGTTGYCKEIQIIDECMIIHTDEIIE